jgi:hypothetical protein
VTDNKDRGTRAANEKGPTAEPFETGLSSNVLRELDSKMHPSIAARVKKHLADKNG